MKAWLDDERPAPKGWERFTAARDLIEELSKRDLDEISLDHDLGDGRKVGTGYKVLVYIERELADGRMRRAPRIHIHTANPVARKRMEAARDSIERLQRMLDGACE